MTGHEEDGVMTVYTGFMADVWMGLMLLAGALVGSIYTVSHGRTDRQRRFLVRVCVVIWIEVAIFIAIVLKTPRPYSFLVCLPYVLIGPVTVARIRSGGARLVDSEETAQSD